jgi:nicotinate-nucleotide pyrophosphorylase (carboxylating)
MKRTIAAPTHESDIRDEIFRRVAGCRVTCVILADDEGIVAETDQAAHESKRMGLHLKNILKEGTQVRPGDEIARFRGSPRQIAEAEDVLIGLMAKPSGIATAARSFVTRAGGRPEIVCGAWKKMHPAEKQSIRRAVVVGGAYYRISRDPFVYLDKNYIRILGGVRKALEAVRSMADRKKVVQIKGRDGSILEEALEAVQSGAQILHIDTGDRNDIDLVAGELTLRGLRNRVRVAFSGSIRLQDVAELKRRDVDILDIGRQIVDAPLLDMRLEVIESTAD